MGFTERTGSWCSHCNLLVKQWIVLSRLTKALFFSPSFALFLNEESNGEGYHVVISRPWNREHQQVYSTPLFALRELNRRLEVHTEKGKKITHKKTACCGGKEGRIKQEHKSEGFANTTQCRTSQCVGEDEHGQPTETTNRSLRPRKTTLLLWQASP